MGRWYHNQSKDTRMREVVTPPVLKASLGGPWDMPAFSHWPGAGPRV